MRGRPSRRRTIAVTAGLGVGLLAGCTGSNGEGTDASTDADTTTPPSDGLDLREANVVGVTVDGDGDAYDFAVTLHHDDDGEEGYADWWQVERLDGTGLGRRELRHTHSQQPFTRSETVEIPDDVDCVVIRGHDQTHEYGGRLAVVDLESGATRSIDQGPEPQSVDADACPSG